MNSKNQKAVTEILQSLRSNQANRSEVENQLYQTVYQELRRVASGIMRAEGIGHTLQPTALVHEAYLKLMGGLEVDWQDRAHFLGVASRAMRQILVDHARRRRAQRRGGSWDRVPLADSVAVDSESSIRILDLDRALKRLSKLSARMATVAEWRIFCGLTHEEIGAALSVSSRTAANDWSVAKRWLTRELVTGSEA